MTDPQYPINEDDELADFDYDEFAEHSGEGADDYPY